MTTYLYSGPMSAATLPDGREVVLIDGQSIDLPEDNAWVQTLAARGHLAPAAPAPAAKTGKTAQKGD